MKLLLLSNKNVHNLHHAHTYKELEKVRHFDDFNVPLLNKINEMLWEFEQKFESSTV